MTRPHPLVIESPCAAEQQLRAKRRDGVPAAALCSARILSVSDAISAVSDAGDKQAQIYLIVGGSRIPTLGMVLGVLSAETARIPVPLFLTLVWHTREWQVGRALGSYMLWQL